MIGKPTGKHPDKRLSAVAIRHAKEGFHADGHGLYLKVDKAGKKRWIQRIVISGKRTDIGLGPVALVGLSEAREKALANRKMARAGEDPLAAKRQSTALLSFEAAARRVHDLNKPTWRSGKHGDQWLTTLDRWVFPLFGTKRIDRITSADVLAALTPVWNEHPETARRIKQRIGTVLKWSIAQGWRTDNPADAIAPVLPKHDRSLVTHHKALPYDKVGAAIQIVRASKAGDVTKLLFEFIVLTASRSKEGRGATWSEIDFDKAVWTVPGTRMKTKKAHRVPLSQRCLEILEQAKELKRKDNDLVFPAPRSDKPLSDMTLSKLMKELGIDAVPHGFRSSFRDWAGEQTNHPREVCEFALAHVISDKAEAAYARSDLFDKRRLLMEDWSQYAERP